MDNVCSHKCNVYSNNFFFGGGGVRKKIEGLFNFTLSLFRSNHGNLGSGGFLILHEMSFPFYFNKGEGGDFKKAIKMQTSLINI